MGKAEQSIRIDQNKLRDLEKEYDRMLSKKNKYKTIVDKIAICDVSIQNLEKYQTHG